MRLMVLAALAAAAHAAVIRGTVIENLTGKLLTRAVVTLVPLEPTPGALRSMRTTRLGAFEFDDLPAGAYLLKVSRRGFIPAEYGQKRWNSAGQPVVLEQSATTFLALRDTAFLDPRSYFHRYSLLSDDEAAATALAIWERTNRANLEDNILPTRPRATLILKKGADHVVETVALRRL